jgi:hypothetical protein
VEGGGVNARVAKKLKRPPDNGTAEVRLTVLDCELSGYDTDPSVWQGWETTGIHREVSAELEVGKFVLLGKVFRLQHFIFQLPLNLSKGHHRRLVAGDLEQAAEQHRVNIHLGTGVLKNVGEHFVRLIRIWVSKVENKIQLGHEVSP